MEHVGSFEAVTELKMNLVDRTAEIRRQSRQFWPSFSTHKIIDACFPRTLVCGADLPIGIEEAVQWTANGPVIVYSRSLSGPAQRFAIAHALGHLEYDGFERTAFGGLAGDLFSEYRADEFAAELLAPAARVADLVARFPSVNPDDHDLYLDQVDEIASYFAVPALVIDQRIRLLIAQ